MKVGRTILIAAACAATAGPAQAESYFFRAKPAVSRPQGFSFAGAQAANPGDATASSPVRIVGHRGRTATVSGDAGAAFQVCAAADCSDAAGWTASPVANLPDDFYARVRVTAGPLGSERKATLALGDAAATFAASTRPADTDPDPVTIAATSNASAGQATASTPVKLSGHDGIQVSVSGSGASYRLCKDSTCSANPAWASAAGAASRDDWVQLRATAPAAGTTATVATLSYGGRTATWSVASRAQDACQGSYVRMTTPNGFVADICGWSRVPSLRQIDARASSSSMAVLVVTSSCGTVEAQLGGTAGTFRSLGITGYNNCNASYGSPQAKAEWEAGAGVALGGQYVVRSEGTVASGYTVWPSSSIGWEFRTGP